MARYLAELVGTFVLVFAGCGTAVLAGPQVGVVGVALAFGLALLVMVYTIGPISGCHINPAVTVGALIGRRISAVDAAFYIVAQIVGAIAASALLLAVAKGVPGGYSAAASGFAANGFGAHSPGGYGMAAGFVVEIVGTFFLVITVLGATDVKAPAGFAGIAIGLALALSNLVAMQVTNASINPARSIGPAVFVGGWALKQLWLFIVAPLIGAVVAAGIYEGIHHAEKLIATKGAKEELHVKEAHE